MDIFSFAINLWAWQTVIAFVATVVIVIVFLYSVFGQWLSERAYKRLSAAAKAARADKG